MQLLNSHTILLAVCLIALVQALPQPQEEEEQSEGAGTHKFAAYKNVCYFLGIWCHKISNPVFFSFFASHSPDSLIFNFFLML